ncbi:MAG TPA: DUF6057 family protein [Thermoguttaceae bacterium]|nr:DUF6057 family protein [Thermoguttaceae bacterium]
MSKQLPSYVGLVVLFLVSFVVLNGIYGYVIVLKSESNDGFFMFGRPFLLEFLDHPAGPLRYAGRFLGQFYHYRWLGALIVSASIACFGFLFYHVLAKLERTVSVGQTLVPCALLLALHTSRIYLIQDTLGLSASCAAFLGYLSLRGKVARRAYALAATPVVYLALGVYAWFFVAWIAAVEWLDGPLCTGLLFKLFYVLFSIAVPLAAWCWIFTIPLRSALICPVMFIVPFRSGWPPGSPAHIAVDCFLAVVLCASVLLIPFWGRLSSGRHLAARWRAVPDRWRRLALAVALPVLALLLHVFRYEPALATVAACRGLYQHEQWDALLEKAKRSPPGDIRLQFMTDFALCKKRRLLDEMFDYRQVWCARGLVLNFSGRLGLGPGEDDNSIAIYNSDLFYEMGHVNVAFTHAYNYMNAVGQTYEVLKRMAQCNMANGNYAAAAKYLNLLEKTLFHRDFARRYQAIIADPDAAEREFGDLRKRLPVAEHDVFAHPVVPFLALLERSDNPMAFDYLMAWCLLDKKTIAAIPAYIDRFKSAGYTSIPTHCQEALLLLERQQGTPVDLRGYTYDEATKARAEEFFQDLARHGGREDAPQQFQALYGDTYMFYYVFVAMPSDVLPSTGARGGLGETLREE